MAFPIHDRTQAGEARRRAASWGKECGWGEDLAGRVALVVTELGTNLALHSGGGTLLLRGLSRGTNVGVEILSVDAGPGVANFHECMRDGFSTTGTSGTGLGAVRRASLRFGSHSQPGIGTAVLSEVWATPDDTPPSQWEIGAVNVPAPRELVCGDAWSELSPSPGLLRVLLADGLGHGEFAADAALKAVEVFRRQPTLELTQLLAHIHDALRSTRGAAVSVAELDLSRRVVSYVGVGNIAASIVAHGTSTSFVSLNGTVGVNARQFRLFTQPWPAGSIFIMATDGLKSQWHLERCIGLLERPASLIAGTLYRDYLRGSDDATALVVRSRS